MQVLLNTDHHVDGRQEMADHLSTVVKDALHRFGDHITRVEAHLSDANSHVNATPDEIHCTLEARIAGQEPVVVNLDIPVVEKPEQVHWVDNIHPDPNAPKT